jgi:hypothetical protein
LSVIMIDEFDSLMLTRWFFFFCFMRKFRCRFRTRDETFFLLFFGGCYYYFASSGEGCREGEGEEERVHG